MIEPQDDVTALWCRAGDRIELGSSVLAWRSAAPRLRLANFLYAVRPGTVRDLENGLARAAAYADQHRIVIDPDTPRWVEAELLLRGWQLDTEFRLVLDPARQLTRSETVEVRPARDLDADWSGRAAMLRIDHLEEDARLGVQPRSPTETAAVIEHRRALEHDATYYCTGDAGQPTGFVCGWRTPQDRGVIEDVFVHPEHRGRGLATGLIGHAVAQLRRSGADAITIAAEVGDTPVQMYARLGFRPSAVQRFYLSP